MKNSRFFALRIFVGLVLFACSNSIAQTEQGAAKDPGNPTRATTRVEAVDILGDAQAADLRTYVESSILPLVRANWYRQASKSREKASGDVTVEFTILKDGSLSGTKLMDGAGHAALGDLAVSAVTKSAPFPPLPVEFTGPSLCVRARFLYESGISSQGSSGEEQSSMSSSLDAEQAKNTTPGQPTGMTTNVDGEDGPVYRTILGLSPPRVIYHKDPEFSEEARKKKVSGIVLLSIVVTSRGNVTAIRVTKGLGSGLDEKAIEAVREWKFKPATKDGNPVSVQLVMEVDFHQ